MIRTVQSHAKRLCQGFFARFGLRVMRLPRSGPPGGGKYFNTGNLQPLEENSRDLYDHFYSDHEVLLQYYDEQRLAFYTAVSDCLRDNGLKLDGKDLLDVGCGTGHLLFELQKWSKPRSLVGCDFSEEAMKFSRERFPGCRFFTHDICGPLPGIYDVVLCTEVLEHLEKPFVAIQHLINAVRPGGHVVITVPNGRLDQLNEHINFWSPESWKAFVERECPDSTVATSLLQAGRYNFALIQRPSAE
jgi:2-polyprenyl-3-methyl-5-hydroxy-6-metoxy-1,4-benzoquinol methylase